jgi:cell division septation protein DedD
MSDSIFNFGFSRPRRRIEPQMSDESGDPGEHSHAPDRHDPGADSLNELARLIGQTDPLPPAGEGPGGRLADISRTASSPAAAAQREEGSAEDRFRQRQFEGLSFEGRSSFDKGASVRRESDFARSRLPGQPNHLDHPEAPADNFDFLQLPDRDDYAVAPRDPMAGEDDFDRDHREGSLTGRRHPPYGQQAEEYADDYHEYEYDERDEETEYEEPDGHEMGAKKRSTGRLVVAVLGLAVFGTAAAFGYRTIFKAAPSGSTPTPIIRADNSPTKITPVSADANAKATSVFDDRSREQLIPRDEEPVDVAAAPYGPGGTAADSSASMSVPPRGNPALSGDAKRVRTVPIRADQSEAPDRSASRSVPPPQSQPRVPPQTRQVAAAPQPPAPPPQRQVAAATSPSPSPAGDAKGTAVANVPEPAASRGIEAGGFVVQLSAARSETDAQASFRTLQGKYPALSGREPLIRRKDLGERGIFFATQVGPFGAKSEADQLCETLKSAGGACFVQKN